MEIRKNELKTQLKNFASSIKKLFIKLKKLQNFKF